MKEARLSGVAFVALLVAAALALTVSLAGCGGSSESLKWTDVDPSWSPNGKLIAFGSNRAHPGEDAFDLYVMRADGSAVRLLARVVGSARSPTFSPDGKRILFLHYPNATDADAEVEVIARYLFAGGDPGAHERRRGRSGRR